LNTQLTVVIPEPLDILRKHTASEDPGQYKSFFETITHVYQFKLLKDILDFTVAKAHTGFLNFRIQEKKFFEMDEGNCRSMQAPNVMSAFFNKFRSSKNYIITIKKIASDVIMHEIGHMVEQELEEIFEPEVFAKTIGQNIASVQEKSRNLSLIEAVKSIMVKEVAAYPKDQRISELFARYFQMLASSRDVVRYGTSYSYSLIDMAGVFSETIEYMTNLLCSFYKTTEYFQIKAASQKYIKELNEIEHAWSVEKIHSFHKEKKESGKPVWHRNIQSIKEDPFKQSDVSYTGEGDDEN
jgi:hypothetical protein